VLLTKIQASDEKEITELRGILDGKGISASNLKSPT
jgi:hypothetical protein